MNEYRELKAGETLQEGDEFKMAGGAWITTCAAGEKMTETDWKYRRRIPAEDMLREINAEIESRRTLRETLEELELELGRGELKLWDKNQREASAAVIAVQCALRKVIATMSKGVQVPQPQQLDRPSLPSPKIVTPIIPGIPNESNCPENKANSVSENTLPIGCLGLDLPNESKTAPNEYKPSAPNECNSVDRRMLSHRLGHTILELKLLQKELE